ncbi:MAG: MmcQ/YjbR family DNA-binding protein [Chloroflexota bacterium]
MSEHKHNPAHKAVLDSLLLGMPGVKDSKAFGYPAYKVNGRVFAFVGTGVSLKLPATRVQELLAAHPDMKPFEVADGVVWREWVSIQRPNSEDYAQDVDLFEESSQFVAGG